MIKKIMEYISELTGAGSGQLPEEGGLVMQLAPVSEGTTYFDGSSSDNMSLLFLCKDKRQQNAVDRLDAVCSKLTRTKKHLYGIYNLRIATPPNYVGRESNYWIYSCIINFKYYKTEGFINV